MASNEQDEGWEEDEDMDDLFSFGTDGANPDDAEEANKETATAAATDKSVDAQSSTMALDSTLDSSERERAGSDDSFLDLLEENKVDTKASSTMTGLFDDDGDGGLSGMAMNDKETEEMLSWLDEEENVVTIEEELDDEPVAPSPKRGISLFSGRNRTPTTKAAVAAPPPPAPQPEPSATIVDLPPIPKKEEPPAPPPPTYDTLADALASDSKPTTEGLRELFVAEGMKLNQPELRKELWCRMVNGNRSMEVTTNSSMADSFQQWRKFYVRKGNDALTEFVEKEASLLAHRIVTCCPEKELEDAKDSLQSVILFYAQRHQVSLLTETSEASEASEANKVAVLDPLLPPVACTILTADIPADAASVLLSSIIPSQMPLMALTQAERLVAAQSLHSQLYLLACYHLPLLVFHLDRYAPGWYWPKHLHDEDSADEDVKEESATQKGRNLKGQGVVPQSWLISHLAGECSGTLMNPKWLLSLWDLILTSSNNSLRFFLSLALLEKHSDDLLMLTGDDLIQQLNRIMEFKEGTTVEGFAITGEEETSASEATDWVQEWCTRARSLWESTPKSVVSQLRVAEDEAVNKALTSRRKLAEEAAQAKMEEEARIHREAQAAERERKAEEHRKEVTRQRLLAFYQKHNPEKIDTVDEILVAYETRLDVLDNKLKAKYGQGFRPMVRPVAMTKATAKLLGTMNSTLNKRRKELASNLRSDKPQVEEEEEKKPDHGVTVSVSASEVLPVVCWTREAARAKANAALERKRQGVKEEDEVPPLKYYLVDSRPDETSEDQGRFPTALNMSPEALLDPDRISMQEEMFESLRGSVHIVVMGEGFSALERLYSQKTNPKLEQLIKEDESRTSLCALFFVKKGFPFVSILDGGFCTAHAWLYREGPKHFLDAKSALVDYKGEQSFFGQLEQVYQDQQAMANASTAEKTSRMVQNLVDSSMVSLTRNAARLENFAANTSSRIDNYVESSRTSAMDESKKSEDGTSSSRVDGTSTEESAPSMGRFAGLGRAIGLAQRVGSIAENKDDSIKESEEDEIIDMDATKPVPPKPQEGTFARLSRAASSALKKDDTASEESKNSRLSQAASAALKADEPPPPPTSRFAGLGASLSMSVKGVAAAAPKTNPFARFNTPKATPKTASETPSTPTVSTNKSGGFGLGRLLRSSAAATQPAPKVEAKEEPPANLTEDTTDTAETASNDEDTFEDIPIPARKEPDIQKI